MESDWTRTVTFAIGWPESFAVTTPSSGRAVFQGQDLQTMTDRQRSLLRRDRIGFVFQAFNLLDHLTVLANVVLLVSVAYGFASRGPVSPQPVPRDIGCAIPLGVEA